MANDLIHRAMKWVDHNWPLALGATFAAVIVMTGIGCQTTTRSPFSDGQDVNRAQLTAEVESYAVKVKAAYADLDRQDAAIERAISTIVGIVETAGGPAAGTTLATILGLAGLSVGAGQIGNVRKKNLKIAELKKGETPTPPQA